MRTSVYPINKPKRVLPENTQQPRKDKGTHYRYNGETRVIVTL